MKACIISILLAVGALAQSSNSTTSAMSTSTSTSSSPDYSITVLPVVASMQSSIPCLYNCLVPIGLADPSGCNEVSNDCACLSAPAGAQQVITECINTVCNSSTSQYASTAVSLYQSYCSSAYPAALLSSATSAESVSDAQAATMKSSSTTASATTSASASATSKNEAGVWQPSLYVPRRSRSRASASNNGTGTMPALQQFSGSFCSASSSVIEQQALHRFGWNTCGRRYAIFES